MYPKDYYIKYFKELEQLMIPNKLYNARHLLKLIHEKYPKFHQVDMYKVLTYARNNGLIHYDQAYSYIMIYWRVTK